MRQFIQRNLNRFGLEIRQTSLGRNVMDFIADREVDVILDVGANVGQFGEMMRAKGYRGRFISFEPILAAYQALTAKASADGNWETNNFALSAQAEPMTIHVSAL